MMPELCYHPKKMNLDSLEVNRFDFWSHISCLTGSSDLRIKPSRRLITKKRGKVLLQV